MKVYITKHNGDSEEIDTRVIHIVDCCSIADRPGNIQLWSDPIQHKNVKHRTEIVFAKQ